MKKLLLTLSFLFAVIMSFAQTQTEYATLQNACDANAVGSTLPHSNKKFYYFTYGDGLGFKLGRIILLDTTKNKNIKFDYKTTKTRIGYFQQKNTAFQVDKTGKVTSILACTTPITPPPTGTPADLVVTSIMMTPAKPSVGQAVTFKAVVKNQGGTATVKDIKLGVLFTVTDGNGNKSYTWSDTYFKALGAGKSDTLTANGGSAGATWAYTLGSVIEANANDGKLIAESNYTNNTLIYSALTPTTPTTNGINLTVLSVAMNPSTPSVGQNVTFSAIIKNIGNAPTPPKTKIGVLFTVIDANGNKINYTWSDTHFTSLGAGQSDTFTANGGLAGSSTWTCANGTFNIEANVNDGKLITESNYADNILAITSTAGTVTNTGGTNVDNSKLTIVEPYSYTPTNKFSDIGWNKFPKFTAPTDGINIFNMAGANQAVEQGGTVMDWGWTHAANYDGRTAKTFGSHANKWTDPYAVQHGYAQIGCNSGVAKQFSDGVLLDESNIDYNTVLSADLGATVCSVATLDIESDDAYFGSGRGFFDFRLRAVIGKAFSDGMKGWGAATPLLASYAREPFTAVGHDSLVITTFATCPPAGSRRDEQCNNVYVGKSYRYNINTPVTSDFTANLGTGGGVNFPSSLSNKTFLDVYNLTYLDMYPNGSEMWGDGTYYTHFEDSRALYTVRSKDGFNILTSLLQRDEVFRKNMPAKFFTSTNKHNVSQLLWLRTEYPNHLYRIYQKKDGSDFRKTLAKTTDPAPASDEYMKVWWDNCANDVLMPNEVSRALGMFTIISGARGAMLWDYADQFDLIASSTPYFKPLDSNGQMNQQYLDMISTPSLSWANYVRNTKYSALEAFQQGFHMMYGDHKDSNNVTYNLKDLFFNNYCLYLNQDTEVDYADGKGFQKLTATQIEKADYPFVRAVVNPATNKILILAVKLFQPTTYTQAVTVRYNGKIIPITVIGQDITLAFTSL